MRIARMGNSRVSSWCLMILRLSQRVVSALGNYSCMKDSRLYIKESEGGRERGKKRIGGKNEKSLRKRSGSYRYMAAM